MKLKILIFLFFILIPVFAFGEFDYFAIVSDTHVGAPDSVYHDFINMIKKENINTIIHVGDAIHTPGKRSEWEKFFEITGNNKRIFIAPGNHDINDKNSLKVFLRFFPHPYHSHGEDDTLLIFLNTELEGQGIIKGEQLEWLKKELKRDFKFKFVFLHRPLFPIFANRGLDKFKKERDELHELFVKNGVSLVVSGHDHLYKRMTKDGITYVICAGAGGQNHFPFFNDVRYYFRYIVGKRIEKGYAFVSKDLTGDQGDEFQILRD